MHEALFSPVQLGMMHLPNRIVMAPMTRNRADDRGVPPEISATYYAQRASAGLIVSEAVQVSEQGKGYCRTPGIHTAQQGAAWRGIADAVRAAGGQLVMQLVHCGRVGSVHTKTAGAETVAPSAIQAAGKVYSDREGMVPFDVPRALATGEIPGVISQFEHGARQAFEAGCAGVELHATSGYLPAQFMASGSNRRTDAYGGNVQGRIRFVVETLEAMSSVRGAERVGIRIGPGNPFNDLFDEDPEETFATLLDAIEPMGLAYLHVIRLPHGDIDNLALARRHFSGPIVANDGFDAAEAAAAIDSGQVSAVSFGRAFIANPDLPEKIRHERPLQAFDRKTLYTPGPRGYIDYV